MLQPGLVFDFYTLRHTRIQPGFHCQVEGISNCLSRLQVAVIFRLRLVLGSDIGVSGSLAHPDTVSFHMPIVSPTAFTVHPLGLDIEEVEEAGAKAYEDSNHPVKDRRRFRIGSRVER